MKRALNKIALLDNLDKETKDSLSAISKIKEYKKGDLLYSHKEKINTIYFILEGVAGLYKANDDNSRKVIFLLGEGNLINEVILFENVTTLSCELLAPTKLLEIPRLEFVKILESSHSLSKAVIESLIKKNKKLTHQLKNISNSITVDRQIAFKLWKLGRDFGKETPEGILIDFDLPITYLAEMLGAKRETVSRQVKLLTELGLISVNKKRFTLHKYSELLDYFHKDSK
ncbi:MULTISPECIES: Crp/Fnr family transcriptional regulator [unclassified Fusobacterium]|uniref:Crp/Fnr family transcriptional regulator n=1 Tax=unclassified Fusobacterium TaxID=2648384 RepID=UPI0025BBD4E5|nr:Crp/Fnr family transcriptional regulator [Fusobacterium sp.]